MTREQTKQAVNHNALRREEARAVWQGRKAEIEWLSQTQDWSQEQIGKRYGVTQSAIYQQMKRLGIQSRNRGNRGERNGRYKDGTQCRLYRQMIVKDKCAECGAIKELAVHHKNGDHYDNRLDNLQILCWSCHNSKTKTLYWKQVKALHGCFPIPRGKDGRFMPIPLDQPPDPQQAAEQRQLL